jgi:hypothetical protein
MTSVISFYDFFDPPVEDISGIDTLAEDISTINSTAEDFVAEDIASVLIILGIIIAVLII